MKVLSTSVYFSVVCVACNNKYTICLFLLVGSGGQAFCVIWLQFTTYNLGGRPFASPQEMFLGLIAQDLAEDQELWLL